MKRALAVISIICIIAIACGCGGGDNNKEPTAKPTARYFPLAAENFWRYFVEDYQAADEQAVEIFRARARQRGTGFFGTLRRVATSQDEDYSVAELGVACNGTVASVDLTWYETAWVQDGTPKGVSFFRHDASGFRVANDWHSEEGLLAVDDSYYRLRTPLQAGNEWEREFSSDQGPYTVTFSIESIEASCEVHAGTFENCIKTQEADELGGTPYKVVTWYAPDVGIVLSEDYEDGKLIGRTELWSYDLDE